MVARKLFALMLSLCVLLSLIPIFRMPEIVKAETPTTGSFGNSIISPPPAFNNLNTSLMAFSQDGYNYKTTNTPYQFYVKTHSSWGDGVKFTVIDNSTGISYSLVYQSQDYSYRDVYGSQDYISSISDVSGVTVGNRIIYPNCYPNVNLEYQALNETIVKENYEIVQLPSVPAAYLTAPVTLDFGGYIKYGSLKLYVDGVQKTGNFITSSQIDFGTDSSNILFHLPAVS